jgi:hypothetical protein
MTVKTIKIQDTGKGPKLVADDLQAVLRKIEECHQGSIAGYSISYQDTLGVWHQLSCDGKEAIVRETVSEQ